MISLLLTAARLLFASYWKKSNLPAVNEWLKKNWKLMMMDEITQPLLDFNQPGKAQQLVNVSKSGNYFLFTGTLQIDWQGYKSKFWNFLK